MSGPECPGYVKWGNRSNRREDVVGFKRSANEGLATSSRRLLRFMISGFRAKYGLLKLTRVVRAGSRRYRAGGNPAAASDQDSEGMRLRKVRTRVSGLREMGGLKIVATDVTRLWVLGDRPTKD